MEAIEGNSGARRTNSSYYTPTASSTAMDGTTNLISSSAAGKAADVQNIINPTNSLTVEGHKSSLISSALASGQSNAYVILPPTIDLSSPDALSALQTIASMNVKGTKTSGSEGSNDGPSTSVDRGDISGGYEPTSTNYSITTNTVSQKKDVKSSTSTDVDMVQGSKSNVALSTTGDLLSAIYAVMALQVQESSDQRQIVNKDARAQRSMAYSESKASFSDKITAAEKQKTADIKNAQAELVSGIASIAGGAISLGMAWKAESSSGEALEKSKSGTVTTNKETGVETNSNQAEIDLLNKKSGMWSAMSQGVGTFANGIGGTISASIRLDAAQSSYESKVQSAMADLASTMMQTFISNMQADQSAYSAASQNIDSTLSMMKQAAQMIYDQNLTINRNI